MVMTGETEQVVQLSALAEEGEAVEAVEEGEPPTGVPPHFKPTGA
jgi:hypothetical protein